MTLPGVETLSRLGAWGFLATLVIAFVMFSTLERTFNRIWRVARRRSVLVQFTMFYTLATLGPLLMLFSLATPLLSGVTVVLASGAGLKGLVGGQSDKGFTLLGDPINLAFRLEEAIAKLGQRFIIPKVTADLIRDQIALRKIIGVKVRDDEPAIDVFVPA